MRVLIDERGVGVHERVEPVERVVTRSIDRLLCRRGGAVHAGAGDGCEEPPLVAEVDVRRLVTHADLHGHLTQAQALGRLVSQLPQGCLHQSVRQRLVRRHAARSRRG